MQLTRQAAEFEPRSYAAASIHQQQMRVLDDFFQNGQQRLLHQEQASRQSMMHYELMEINEYLNYKALQQSPQIGSGLGGHCESCKFRHPLPNGLHDWQCLNCFHYNRINLSWEAWP